MLIHKTSIADDHFRLAFESGRFDLAGFDHRAHLRLAYIYSTGNTVQQAYSLMRNALIAALKQHGVDPNKYSTTITHAWIAAVRHFIERTNECVSADDFLEQNPALLNADIMLTHYTPERLFSGQARAQYLAPDLDPIPEYPGRAA